MKVKTTKNPRGSGREKSLERLKLESVDLIKLLETKSTTEICWMYGVTRHIYYNVLSEQLKNRVIGLKEHKEKIFNNSINLYEDKYKGAWMGSNARAFMVDNGLMEYQQIND